VPIVGKQIELNKINKQIYSIEKKNVSISWDIAQLSLEWAKCEQLQSSASSQAAWKRWEIENNDSEIEKLKQKYNILAGFISRL
jgi:predicted RNase H-like nuclease (RuvC/YqgF family)